MLPTSIVDQMSLRMADEICRTWRSFREHERLPQIRARLQVAIAQAIVEELIYTTKTEMRLTNAR
jgi:hypothetical protein